MNDNGIEGSSAVPELPNKGSSVTILPDCMLQIKFGRWTLKGISLSHDTKEWYHNLSEQEKEAALDDLHQLLHDRHTAKQLLPFAIRLSETVKGIQNEKK